MKKIVSCFLSCVLLLQTLAYSQTVRPTKQQVENIYNKVLARVNSATVLKDFKDDKEITPLLSLAVVASAIKINTQEDMAYWLEQFEIPITADAPVVDIYDKVYSQLKIDRFANNLITESADNTYYEAAQLLNHISMEDPTVIENCVEYLEIIKELNIAEEAQKIGIQRAVRYTQSDLEIAATSFAESCAKAEVNPVTVINAYANYTRLPDLLESVSYDEKLLTDFTRQLSVLKGRYLALSELMSTEDEKEIMAIVEKYGQNYNATQKTYLKQLKGLDKYFKQAESRNDPVLMKLLKQRIDFVEDINLRHLENEGRMITTDAFYSGKITPTFTRTGVFALSMLALFDIAQHLMKVQNIKNYSAARNFDEFALQDALEDNKNNLYAFIEKLPENTRNTAFNYIAENYYDDFQNQTDNLLYALAVLEKSSLNTTHKNQKNIEQQVNNQLDKTYKNTEKKIKQDALNM